MHRVSLCIIKYLILLDGATREAHGKAGLFFIGLEFHVWICWPFPLLCFWWV